jgi:hypothetical protein
MRHLSTNDLISYAERRTSLESQHEIEDHIRICLRCAVEADRWIELIGLLAAKDLASAPKAAIRKCVAIYQMPERSSFLKEIVALLVFDSMAEPAMVGVRGAGDSQHVLLQSDDVEIYLRISSAPRNILGQLLRTDGEFVTGARMELIHCGEAIDMTVTDRLGEFRFNTVPEGELRLQADVASEYRLIADFAIRQ